MAPLFAEMLCSFRFFFAHAEDVQPAEFRRRVGGERAVIGVVGVRRHQDLSVLEAHDDGRVIPVSRRSSELHEIALFELFEGDFLRVRAFALVRDEEVIEENLWIF